MPASGNPPRGGVGTKETPATNVGGGSGLGDSYKSSGPTTGQFSSLTGRKGIERESDGQFEKDDSNPDSDRSFMAHKPGHPETLPGWDKLKDVAGYTS